MPSRPTKWQFFWQVRARALKLENGRWLYKVFEVSIWIVASLAPAVITGVWGGVIAGAITGCIGLLSLFVCRYAFFILDGAHSIHCEQLDNHHQAECDHNAIQVELSAAMDAIRSLTNAASEKPLQVVDVKKHLLIFADWLKAQAHGRVDLSEHKARFMEVMLGIFPHGKFVWETTDFRGKQPNPSNEFLENKASTVRAYCHGVKTRDDFNENWRPPQWLAELGQAPAITAP